MSAPREKAMDAEMALLTARAERVRRARGREEELAITWMAEFPLRDERLAVRLEYLRAAIPLRLVRSVPLAPPHVLGVVRHEGQLLCAYSLASLVGVRGWRKDPAVLLVVEAEEGHRFAIDCESIPRPLGITARALDEARARASDASMVDVLREDATVVTVIDLVARVRRATSDAAPEGGT